MTFRVGQFVVCVDGHTQNELPVLQRGWVYRVYGVWDDLVNVGRENQWWMSDRFVSLPQSITDISVFTDMLTKEPPIEDLVMTAYLMNAQPLPMDLIKPTKPVKHAV